VSSRQAIAGLLSRKNAARKNEKEKNSIETNDQPGRKSIYIYIESKPTEGEKGSIKIWESTATLSLGSRVCVCLFFGDF
jgi:hypothetical protein